MTSGASDSQAAIEHAIADTGRHLRRCLEGTFYGPPEEQPDPASRQVERDDPAANSALIKAAGKRVGADLVGICRLNPDHLFPGAAQDILPESCQWVVVMAVAMDADSIRQSPGPVATTATILGYVRAATCSSAFGVVIRTLGYQAVSAGNGIALNVPLAVDAGLGETGRSGMLITDEFGPCVRLCKVFTDLPLAADPPADIGVRARCEVCQKCVSACPAEALNGRRHASLANALSEHLDADKCRAFWQENGTACSSCVAVCPLMPAQDS